MVSLGPDDSQIPPLQFKGWATQLPREVTLLWGSPQGGPKVGYHPGTSNPPQAKQLKEGVIQSSPKGSPHFPTLGHTTWEQFLLDSLTPKYWGCQLTLPKLHPTAEQSPLTIKWNWEGWSHPMPPLPQPKPGSDNWPLTSAFLCINSSCPHGCFWSAARVPRFLKPNNMVVKFDAILNWVSRYNWSSFPSFLGLPFACSLCSIVHYPNKISVNWKRRKQRLDEFTGWVYKLYNIQPRYTKSQPEIEEGKKSSVP